MKKTTQSQTNWWANINDMFNRRYLGIGNCSIVVDRESSTVHLRPHNISGARLTICLRDTTNINPATDSVTSRRHAAIKATIDGTQICPRPTQYLPGAPE
ncbi:unnamed protein product [Prorocentrum cordatum]|uniref:FHA domain-containing protein n=1 Tax=Prorocentrum cordatum TaxID=2364126 RepID=A0ABN9QFF6_9DINO|nr:unnamed protein product [Polarella glacialis]